MNFIYLYKIDSITEDFLLLDDNDIWPVEIVQLARVTRSVTKEIDAGHLMWSLSEDWKVTRSE